MPLSVAFDASNFRFTACCCIETFVCRVCVLILSVLGKLLVVLCSFEFTLFDFDRRSQVLFLPRVNSYFSRFLRFSYRHHSCIASDVAFHYNSDINILSPWHNSASRLLQVSQVQKRRLSVS